LGNILNQVILVSGRFNVIHPGHTRLFNFAKEFGGVLVVAVECDKMAGEGAYVPENLRIEGVRNNVLVDQVVLLDEPIEKYVLKLKPNIVVKGKEFESKYNPEQKVLESYGGRLVFSSGESIFSSIELLKKEFNGSEQKKIIDIPIDYLKRHNIDKNALITYIEGYGQLNICVLGDLILDEYITCEPLGMSQEDPTVVVMPIDSTKFIGGAGIVAAHASKLGAKTKFYSVSGVDADERYAKMLLSEYGVDHYIEADDSRPTTLKQRYRSKGKSLLRVSKLHQGAISKNIQDRIIENVSAGIKEMDLLVFSDFNYGCLPQYLVDKITLLARNAGVMLAADSQSSSQIGDIGRYKGMNLITPTEREARIALRNAQDGLIILAEELKEKSFAKNILLKLGEEGLIIQRESEYKDQNFITDKLGALNLYPKDVAGAGDSLLICSAMAMARGANIWEAALIGSVAAAIQVSRVGNTPLSATELIESFKE
jgi:rfaE bifunctional protein kinase chain/domain